MKGVSFSWLLLLVFASLATQAQGALDSGGENFSEPVVTIRERAKEEGKPYLVHFTAKWCMPCRWMESTTYKDDRVAGYLSEHYLSARVDIDDFDGFAWKEYYGVRTLPTILVFSRHGELLEKRENSLSASELLSILEQYQDGQRSPGEGAALAVSKETVAFGHAGHIQFGAFSSRENAGANYDRLSKILTFPIEIEDRLNGEGNTIFIVRSIEASDELLLEKWLEECTARQVDHLPRKEKSI